MKKRAAVMAGMLLVATLGACARTPATPAASVDPAPAAAADEAGSGAAPDVVVSAEQPSLVVPTVDGGQFDLAAQRGKWVVVNFWATWCGPCVKEMPELSALNDRRRDVAVVGLAYEETDADSLRQFLQQRPVSYPVAIADPYDPPRDFATPRGLPMTFLVAPDGRLAEQFMGPVTGEQLEQVIARLAGEAG